jgi:hypothetical protein
LVGPKRETEKLKGEPTVAVLLYISTARNCMEEDLPAVLFRLGEALMKWERVAEGAPEEEGKRGR